MSEMTEDVGDQHEPTEITYDEHLHPARPRTLRFRPRVRAPFTRRSMTQDGPPTTVTTVAASATSTTRRVTGRSACSGLEPAPGSVGVRGSNPLSSTV
jgi:hypothetical protein